MNRTPTTSRTPARGGIINAVQLDTMARVGLAPAPVDLLSLYGIHASPEAYDETM